MGYSLKLNKVYTTMHPSEAKRFTSVGAQEFLSEHCNKNRCIELKDVKIHVCKPGRKFVPFPDDGENTP